jgi:hypothetical protein
MKGAEFYKVFLKHLQKKWKKKYFNEIVGKLLRFIFYYVAQYVTLNIAKLESSAFPTSGP